MTDMRQLYSEVIKDHKKDPRNFTRIEDATHRCAGDNPLCGDNISLELQVQDNIITNIGFQGSGCAISVASSSLMTEAVKGKSVEEALSLFAVMKHLFTDENAPVPEGKLKVLAGVRAHPSRVKCASLPWYALECSLQKQNRASTE